MPTFFNDLFISATNDTFQVDAPTAAVSITQGIRSWVQVLNDFLTQLQTVQATGRIGLDQYGHITIDNDGGGNFTIDWTDTNLRDLMGFTGNLASANSYTAPRRIGGALHLAHRQSDGRLDPTIYLYHPNPMSTSTRQTRSSSGVARASYTGNEVDTVTFQIQNLDNSARLVSPTGAVATTYANAADTDPGLTMYEHAKVRWRDSFTEAYQGWCDGRQVWYFPDASDAAKSISGASWVVTSGYTAWTFDQETLAKWTASPVRVPKEVAFHLKLNATQYVAP